MKMGRLLVIMSLAFTISAVQVPPLFGDEQNGRERDLSRVRKKIETLRAWQLTEELDLDEETSAKLFPAMKQADEERWRLEARNRQLLRQLAQTIERGSSGQEEIDSILDEMLTNRRVLTQVEEKHIKRVRQLLSAADTARYIMFQIRFQKEIRARAAEAMRDKRRRDERDLDRRRDRGGSFQGSDAGGLSGGRLR